MISFPRGMFSRCGESKSQIAAESSNKLSTIATGQAIA